MDLKSIKFENYKCFKKSYISELKPINVIIGKNNIGKSSILDIIEMIYSNLPIGKTKIILEKHLTEEDISRVFRVSVSGGGIPASNHYEFGQRFIGKVFPFEIYLRGNSLANRIHSEIYETYKFYDMQFKRYWEELATTLKYEDKVTKRILAERNVFPEIESENMSVDGNGNGITTIINNFINKSQYDESLVRETLLDKLNEIMGDDATFTEIVTQQVKDGDKNKWEIFLREEEKGRIPLSESGSGLKTILMVLVYTILIPKIEMKGIDNYIFMFEELENNLHPSLQRRLLKYIEELTKKKAIFFLTTHSNIMLDNFQNNDDINILHVIKDGEKNVQIINSSNKIQKNSILNDLGLRASDLLQSNGIIWVEGPSDRIYINKWIELWSNGTIREGKDYQCVFYGGRLLSNLALDEQEENELVNLINVNRNSIILIDSDKKNNQTPVNKTKKRIQEESDKNSIMCWITKGREIENYIPGNLIKNRFNLENKKRQFEQFENLEEFLDDLDKGLGKKFLRDKITFARKMTENVNLEDYKNSFDLDIKMKKVIENIKLWNK